MLLHPLGPGRLGHAREKTWVIPARSDSQKEISPVAAELLDYWGEDPEMEEFRRYQDLKQQRRRALVSEEYQ